MKIQRVELLGDNLRLVVKNPPVSTDKQLAMWLERELWLKPMDLRWSVLRKSLEEGDSTVTAYMVVKDKAAHQRAMERMGKVGSLKVSVRALYYLLDDRCECPPPPSSQTQ